jgi:putative ABC transport system permease protein
VYHALAPGQIHPVSLALHLRGVDPLVFAGRLREIAATLDPTLRLDQVLPLDDVLREQEGVFQLAAVALALVTASVLLLSGAGIYAMMSFTIAERRKEIGIRTALGANPRRILANIFSRALGQVGIGVVVGVVVAALFDRLADGDLMGGKGSIFLPAVSIVVVIVGIVAAAGPARRGLRIEPIQALREE